MFYKIILYYRRMYMKSSRAMLLSALLFAVPAIAEENGSADAPKTEENSVVSNATPATEEPKKEETPPAEDKKETPPAEDKKEDDSKSKEDKKETTEAPSWFAAKLAVLTGFGTTVASYTITPVAEWTTIPALKKLLCISYLKGGNFEKNIPTIGKSIIVLGTVAAAYQGYKAMQDQDDSNDDEEIFGQ